MVESTRLLVLVVALSSACVALKPVKPDTKADAPAQKRLTLTAIPSNYKITLKPDLDAKTFTGTVDITANVIGDNTKDITFHAAETLTELKGTVKLPDNTTENIDEGIAKVPDTSDVYKATWKGEAPKDKDIILSLTYSGVITEDMDGFYISTYLDGTATKILASTQFESVSARKAFPCLDEPALKATFDMTITVPDTYGVLFNTEGSSTNADGTAVYTFETTPVMSTYLVAFVIYDKATFTSSPLSSTDDTQKVWSRKDLAGQRDTALNAGSQVLQVLSDKFGIKYFDMINKMDQIAIPDFSAGAMENWGLVTYRESALLVDAAKTSTSDKRDVIETVAHEFAHQWFGDYVSPNYWDVLWLNEGFATYWMYHVPIDAYKDFNMEGAFVAIDMETALEADAYETTHAMTFPVPDGEAFEGKFDDISYEKAGSVIRMMRHILGDDAAFDEGLKNYLNARKLSDATPKNLFENLAPGDADFVTRMESWSNSPGYPVIKVERDIEKDTATISQSRYYLKSSDTANKDIPWKTPIIVLDIDTPTNVSNVTWLDGDKAATINNLVDDVPLIINPKRAGFFRVNYDVMNWELIGSMLQNNITRVDAVTRAALISDAFSMARSGHLDYSTALDLSTYLVNEVEYVPWEAAFRHLSFLNSRLVSSDVYNGFKTYVGSLLKKTYDAVGFEIKDTETPENRIHRENVLSWACKIGHQTCSDKAKALDTPDETKMEPDLRAVVLCESVRTNDSRWDELRQEFVKSTSATDKLVILNALGCSDNEEKLQTLLEMARNATQVRPQDLSKAYAAVYNNPKGVDLVLADIGNNTADLVQQFSGLQKILSGLGDKLTTQDQIDKFKALTGLGNAQSAYETALAKAQANLQWLTDNEEKLTTWINKYNSAASATVSILLLAVAAISAFLNH